MTTSLRVDGRAVDVIDDGISLLELLRESLGHRSVKDGCSPQGQCGCCTVLVDGVARVACVTPVRRCAGREVTTLEGLAPDVRNRWATAFCSLGASQCGFCTPGIVVRLAGLAAQRGVPLTPADVEGALLAHLCRCTGWRTIVDAAVCASGPSGGRPDGRDLADSRDLEAAGRRASIEGGVPQAVGPDVALGLGGFADDHAPLGALVAVPDGVGGWSVGETVSEARAAAGKVQGRRSTAVVRHPLEVPPGQWAVELRTTWVEPAYLEPDAAWCEPGGEPVSPLANGGAFGGKTMSPVGSVARRLADRQSRPVRVLWSREDVVRCGPKRPPIAAGLLADGTGILRVVRTPGVAAAVRWLLPDVDVVELDVAGPATSVSLRAAGWAEAAVLLAALRFRGTGAPVRVVSPTGAVAGARVQPDGGIRVDVACGPPLDEVVLRSYCTGAAHQALGWVTREGLAVDEDGQVQDLTIRSFGVLRARETPPIDVVVHADEGPDNPVNGSDAVFAAVAAAVWIDRGLPRDWPTDRGIVRDRPTDRGIVRDRPTDRGIVRDRDPDDRRMTAPWTAP